MAAVRCLIFVLIFIYVASHADSAEIRRASLADNTTTGAHLTRDENGTRPEHKPQRHGVALWGWQWQKVKAYLVVSIFLLVAALVKICYHHLSLHNHVPESCVLITMGTIAGLVLYWTDSQDSVPKLTSDVFFFVLLPPIILESAFSLHDHTFFNNLGTILLYAVVGTLINVFLVASSLFFYGHINAFGDDAMPFVECLVFATLICAVDPVAVLAIFQDLGVNKALYFLVFGESLLNDAVVITLYNTVSNFAGQDSVSYGDIVMGLLNFLTVSSGGLLIGVVFGAITALVTRGTETVRVVEPLVVLIFAYISYIGAELFHFSGIIGLIGCGLMQAEYAMRNISRKSATTIKYFTKNISSVSDVIIFFFLGQFLVQENHVWNAPFIFLTTLFCIIYRFFSVFVLTCFANNCFQRLRLINFEEQVLMAYGGLRGAIAFSLAVSLDPLHVPHKDLFITTALFVILFTVFVMGSTTKAVVRLLRVRIEEKQKATMFVLINSKQIETFMAGFEAIAGQCRQNYWFQRLNHLNDKYLKRYLIQGGAANYERWPTLKVGDKPVVPMERNVCEEETTFTESPTLEDTIRAHEPNDAKTRRKKFKRGSAQTQEALFPLTGGSEASPERRGSIFSKLRRNSSPADERKQIRRQLSSAMSRHTYNQLPSNLYHIDEEIPMRCDSLKGDKRGSLT